MLYQKHRPKTLKKFQGNKETVDALKSMFDQGDFPHAILLYGPTGCGKTTLGRIVAGMLNATGLDYQEIDSADFRGVETVRSIRAGLPFAPLESDCKVVLMDEVHQLGTGGASPKNIAQNALLKALEDPPNHVYFILCTTDPDMLLKTIRGRCVQFQVNPLDLKAMNRLLLFICKKEKTKVPKEVIELIHKQSDGHPRNAIQMLSKVMHLPTNEMEKAAKQFKSIENQSIDLCRALMKGGSWTSITSILRGLQKEEPEGIRRHVLGYMSSVLLNKGSEQEYNIMSWFEEPFYNTGFPGLVLACYRSCNGIEP